MGTVSSTKHQFVVQLNISFTIIKTFNQQVRNQLEDHQVDLEDLLLHQEDLVQLCVKEKLLQEVEVVKVVALCGDFTVKTHLDLKLDQFQFLSWVCFSLPPYLCFTFGENT